MKPLLPIFATLLATARADSPEVNWEDIRPSRDLVYHDCYNDTFKCARLILPLDWLDSQNNHTVIIPMVKLPAVVAENDPTFGGAIITNPGGPGEPGTDFVVDYGHRLQSTADKPGKRHYEIISFDPRGIGSSEPSANCFPSNTLDRIVSTFESRANGASFQGVDAIPYGLAIQELYGKRCKEADGLLDGGIFEYMGTASVARDIIEMVDKIEELRSQEKSAGGDDMRTELRKREADVHRVQYWGFSYGTVLGNVLASMFPERIGRIVLDGVVDAEDFMAGPGYSQSLLDTEKIVERFIHGCFKAGPSKCRLAHEADISTADVKARFSNWFEDIKNSPKVVSTAQGHTFIVTRAEVGRAIGYMLYKPTSMFKELAYILDHAISGNYTSLLAKMLESNILSDPSSSCPTKERPHPQTPSGLDGRNGVVCGDGSDVSHKPVSWWHAYFANMLKSSPIVAPYWSTIRFTCARWPFKQNWSFKGPFTTPKHDAKVVPGRPAAPLLFISNRLDPVTPLAGARKMARKHPGAGLVIQESLGHCALVNGDSGCLKAYVADFFESGSVPTEGKCDVECGPWDDGCDVGVNLRRVNGLGV